MEWQMKKSAWDIDGLQAGSDSTRTPHGNRQWGLQDNGLLFPGLGTTQKTHFPTSSSSGTTTGSLDSASSGFPVPTLSCSSELLLGPCATHDSGKLRNNGWFFGDKEVDVTSSDKRGLPRVASGLKLENSDKQQNPALRMVEKSGNGLYASANGRTAQERAPPRVETIKKSQVSSTISPPTKSPAADEGGKMSSGAGVSVANTGSPLPPAKKPRITAPGVQVPRCQVEGCKADLSAARDYHRRHKVCAIHSKAPKVITSGIEQRFCQQCSRFHVLSEFDDAKRSCRRRLAGHNERRRKSSQDTRALTAASMLQDERRHLTGYMDRPYFMQHQLGMPLSIYENGNSRRGWSRFELEQQLAMACRTQSTLPYSADRLLMILQACKGTTPVSQTLSMSSSQSPNMLAGIEAAAASAPLGSHSGLLDSGRALSLLSSQSRSNHAALEKLMSEQASSLSFQEHYLPDNPITSTPETQSAFSLADFQLNQQKLLALQSSPRSLALSIGMSTDHAFEETNRQHQKPLISNFNVAETLETNPMLAQLLQRPEFSSMGSGSNSQHAKLTASNTIEMQSPNSQQSRHHQQQFASSELQASTTDYSQQVEPFRGYDAFSLLPDVL